MTTNLAFRPTTWRLLSFSLLLAAMAGLAADLPEEKPLWAGLDFKNPIHYDTAETVKQNKAPAGSPSGSNRVFSYVANPTYSIHQAPAAVATGVGLVICPGGGYRDVWLDREGNDLAIWLKSRGVTSLVLKYRTDNGRKGVDRDFPFDVYLPAVFADARQAIRVLRSQAAGLNVDPNKIGICGFSAGGNLAFNAVFRPEANPDTNAVSGEPDFAGLFYPWLRDDVNAMVAGAKRIPPLFIINAADDQMTPVNLCVDFYQALLKANARAELHVFSKGNHGFDLGQGRGESVPLWKESFMAWLKDAKLVK
jgi:acetyl esterase/lipase